MKFKCKSTGLVYEFEFEVDILSMHKHPDYEAVVNSEEVPTEASKPAAKTTKKAKVTSDESSIDGS